MLYRTDPSPEPPLMDWPGLRKVWPVTVVRVPWAWRPEIHWGGDWYYGNWAYLYVGRWMICLGSGRLLGADEP